MGVAATLPVSLRRRVGRSIAQFSKPCLGRAQTPDGLRCEELGLGRRELLIRQLAGSVQIREMLKSGGQLRCGSCFRRAGLRSSGRLGRALAGSSGRESQATDQGRSEQSRPSGEDETTSEQVTSLRILRPFGATP